jgi:hypothetical protein
VREMKRQLEGLKAESRLRDQLVFNVSATNQDNQQKQNRGASSDEVAPRGD